ncbi:hypothetical protein KAW96_05285 [candidate division WOR-3 bacterium]|nr:hypothetical protein [candidate division WOR-3 bacterium]
MPVFRLEQDEYYVITVRVPRRRKPWLGYDIEAEGPVHVYLLDEEELEKYKKGKDFYYYNDKGDRARKYFSEDVDLPFSDKWYLVIDHEEDKSIAIFYKLYT